MDSPQMLRDLGMTFKCLIKKFFCNRDRLPPDSNPYFIHRRWISTGKLPPIICFTSRSASH